MASIADTRLGLRTWEAARSGSCLECGRDHPVGLFAILKANQRRIPTMAGVSEKAAIQDANEAALRKFEEGVRRSIRQADKGLVKTFKTKGEFLNHLKNL
jgi:hypothetical protein